MFFRKRGLKYQIGRFLAALLLCIIGCPVVSQPIAFPGAEGFGKYATGGRGGKVLRVINLNDNGPGSLRNALDAKYPRVIVFSVSGTIHLKSKLTISGNNVTIAGQTAPGDGICIADYPVGINASNVILRYIRFRMGDRYQNKGMIDGGGSDDALSGGSKQKNIIIDHCTMSWSTDEAFSLYAGDSTTLQWNLISEPLNYSYHFEKGDKDFEQHGFGGIWGGAHLSAHHNLFAHCNSRTPRFEGNRHIPQEFVDFRNNVIFNWGTNNVYGGEGGNYNLVNNYYKYGPSTKENVRYRIANPYKLEGRLPFGKFFIEGNYVDGSSEVSNDNWMGVEMNQGTEEDKMLAKVNSAFPAEPITTHSAKDTYKLVLRSAGASLPARDTIDQRIIRDVESRMGRLIDVQGGYKHGAEYSKSKKAWPELKTSGVLLDSDEDGMPDDWEKVHKLDPSKAGDANQYRLEKQYTNVEVYLNSLVK
ncbi:pectate lyase family protein [Desertivirga xinjiangensis]|uniref:pectate lyase family protein n=1 Tax=Desertivirga xinjiangensis TaxID=539206 RepID=UPI00210B4B47|nr:pectate lyase [Pedobacter xinjiangensis]